MMKLWMILVIELVASNDSSVVRNRAQPSKLYVKTNPDP